MNPFTRWRQDRNDLLAEIVAVLGRQRPRTASQAATLAEAEAYAVRLQQHLTRPMSITVTELAGADQATLLDQLLGLGPLPFPGIAGRGGVTVVHLVPVPGDGAPRPTRETVTLLTSDAVRNLARELADLLVTAVDAHDLPVDVSALRHWRPDGPRWPEDLDRAMLGCLADTVWHGAEEQARERVANLLAVLNAASAGLGLISVAEDTPTIELPVGRLAAAVRSLCPRRADGPPSLHAEPRVTVDHELTADALALLLPILARVTVTVELPHDLWPLGGLPVDVVCLPCLDTGIPSERQIVQAGVAQATTLAVVLPADTPAEHAAAVLQAELGRDPRTAVEQARSRVMVGNQFDRVPPPDLASVGLAHLTDPYRCREFAGLYGLATDLTRAVPPRLVLTSTAAHAGLTRVSSRLSRDEQRSATALRQVTCWQTATEELRLQGATNPAARALYTAIQAAAEDGGIGYLRTVLSQHLSGPGVGLRAGELTMLQAQLRKRLALLVRELQPLDAGCIDPELAEGFTELRSRLLSLVRHYRANLPELRHLLHRNGPGETPSVRDQVWERAAIVVHDWDEWNTLFACIDDRGQIQAEAPRDRRPTPNPIAVSEDPLGLAPLRRPPVIAGPPLSTAAFVPGYCEAMREVAATGRSAVRALVAQWARDLDSRRPERTVGLEDDWKQWRPLLERLLPGAVPAQDANDRLARLDWLVNPALVPRAFDGFATDAGADELLPDGTPQGFPFSPNQAFAWHPQVHQARQAAGVDDVTAHVDIQVALRLRRVLVTALIVRTTRQVQASLEHTLCYIEDFLRDLDSVVPSPEEIRRMAAVSDAEPRATDGASPAAIDLPRELAELFVLLNDPRWIEETR